MVQYTYGPQYKYARSRYGGRNMVTSRDWIRGRYLVGVGIGLGLGIGFVLEFII